MPFLFKGEEFNRAARLWTHGYDLYAPRKNYAYHFYDDDPKPADLPAAAKKPRDRSFLHGSSEVSELVLQSELRWQAVFGMLEPPPAVDGADSHRLSRLKNAHARGAQLKDFSAADVELFGVGTRRSLREMQTFSGVSLLKHATKDLCDQIGKMPWVPWDVPRDFEPLGRGCVPPKAAKCRCRSALDQAADRAALYLNLSNHEVYLRTKASVPVAPDSIREPVASRGWWRATQPCR